MVSPSFNTPIGATAFQQRLARRNKFRIAHRHTHDKRRADLVDVPHGHRQARRAVVVPSIFVIIDVRQGLDSIALPSACKFVQEAAPVAARAPDVNPSTFPIPVQDLSGEGRDATLDQFLAMRHGRQSIRQRINDEVLLDAM